MDTNITCPYWILLALVAEEALSFTLAAANYAYAVKRLRSRQRAWFKPKVLLIVPCKGVDEGFEQNMVALLTQDYPNYLVWFVVCQRSDSAYDLLWRLLADRTTRYTAQGTRLLVAGSCSSSSQKVHNLLYCIDQAPPDVEVFAFADTDVKVGPTWLSDLIGPLVNPQVGATTGYRWFIPTRPNLATLTLSCLNAKVAQMLGQTRFNLAWGGSMAIRVQTFHRCNLYRHWQNSLADDLTLSHAVRARGLKIKFVPRCLVPSYTQVNWRQLLEFGRRQLFMTRLYSPNTWGLALLGTGLATIDLLLCPAIAAVAMHQGWRLSILGHHVPGWWIWAVASLLFILSGVGKAILRQDIARRRFAQAGSEVITAMLADIVGFWAWPVLMLILLACSAFGRTIQWRGLRYRVRGPQNIEVHHLVANRRRAATA